MALNRFLLPSARKQRRVVSSPLRCRAATSRLSRARIRTGEDVPKSSPLARSSLLPPSIPLQILTLIHLGRRRAPAFVINSGRPSSFGVAGKLRPDARFLLVEYLLQGWTNTTESTTSFPTPAADAADEFAAVRPPPASPSLASHSG